MHNTSQLSKIASVLVLGAGPALGSLWVDFNSEQDGGGAPVQGDPADATNATHNAAGYSPYHAAHEVAAGFITATYSTTFAITGAATVSLTPTWSNTSDNRVMQSIDRGAGNDANYSNPGAYSLDLVTDWIGVDTRTANGGNGDFNGVSGTPTWIELTLGGLPAAEYQWVSIHHDTENVFSNFNVYVDTGAGFTLVGSGYQNDSSPGGTPSSGTESAGPANTFATNFTADGLNPVAVRFEPLSGEIAAGLVHNQLFAINGFQLEQIPEPSTGILGLLGAGLLLRRRR
jgi:hypothetical protein